MPEEIDLNKPDVFILCGGKGKRFRIISKNIPKALAPINGVPIIDIIIKKLEFEKCGNIILGTGYLSSLIEEHILGKNSDYKIVREEMPLGTGGAIRNAYKYFKSDDILIINGDTIFNFDLKKLIKFHKEKKSDITILLGKAKNSIEYGNIKTYKDRIIDFKEKNNVNNSKINAGVYLIKKKIISYEKKGYSSLEEEWFPKWIKKYKVYGMNSKEYIYDIGTLERYLSTQNTNFN